jgi:hypothetical protein
VPGIGGRFQVGHMKAPFKDAGPVGAVCPEAFHGLCSNACRARSRRSRMGGWV